MPDLRKRQVMPKNVYRFTIEDLFYGGPLMQRSQPMNREHLKVTQFHIAVMVYLRTLLNTIQESDDVVLYYALYKAELEMQQIILGRIGAGAWVESGRFEVGKSHRWVVKGSYPDNWWYERERRLEIHDREKGLPLDLIP